MMEHQEIPAVSYEHLHALSDEVGLFEHAELTTPRTDHGYCVDDVARGLLVAVREPAPDARLTTAASRYLDFVIAAQAPDGSFRNRFGTDGQWHDEPSVQDCWGRALWGLGSCAARSDQLSARALHHFERGADRRSPWPRAMAFAALGAAEVLTMDPKHRQARELLRDAATLIGRPASRSWMWPEPRLRYANASLAEVVLAAGTLLKLPALVRDGLAMVDWLLTCETRNGHLSLAPVGGWAHGEPRPGFDQQPIEAAALADACARAFEITSDIRFSRGVLMAARWFAGDNDAATPLHDPVSGGGYDGLEPTGRNENQGAESTLALISTLQQYRLLFDAAEPSPSIQAGTGP
ncbi:glycosyl transferase [soil metagenome]